MTQINIVFYFLILLLFACSPNIQKDKKNINSEVFTFNENLKVDTSFIRFFEEFMWDKDFQVSRIQFPIQYFGKQISSNKDWKHEEFYSKREFVPILDSDSLSVFFKKIKQNQITIYFTSLNLKQVKNYSFEKIQSHWNLIEAKQIKLAQHPDQEFIQFLSQFWKDSVYQINHIQFPLDELYSDAENDYHVENDRIDKKDLLYWDFLIIPVQIVSFSSENIKTNNRYIYLRGVDNGISVRYKFQKTKSSWRLVLIEDYST